MAWDTMWKIGPEWAAQQAKWVSAMAQKGQKVQSWPAGAAGPPPGRQRRAAAAGARLSRSAQG